MTTFLRRYWPWVLALASVNWVVWMTFELGHSRALGERDLWPLRMYLWSGLLLFDNLCVLWWYAHTTQQQAAAAQRQIDLRLVEWRIQNKPIVFLDRDTVPSRASADRYDTPYIARNVGPGIAINVHVLTVHVDGRWDVDTIGALEAGGSRVLPEHMDRRLEAHAGRVSGRLVVAEAMRTRTVQWVVTLNIPDQTGQIRHGFLSERFAAGVPTLSALQERHGQSFRDALDLLGREVEGARN